MELIQYNPSLAGQALALENTAWPQDAEDEVFPSAPNTYFTSFVWMEDHEAVCHVGIRKSPLQHRGESYWAYGLSEVVTHPRYQNQGLATRAILRAKQCILEQEPDLSIFTCAQDRVGFYTRCGWQVLPGTCLVGGSREKPFRSDSLNLATLMLLISPKAQAHRRDFEGADIFLDLGENQLW